MMLGLIGLFGFSERGLTQVQVTTRVSVSKDGLGGDDGSGGIPPALSANGRFSVFFSRATNLVPSDVNGVADVFIRDNWTGAISLTSAASGGAQGNDASGFSLDVSNDGALVVFSSLADNLVPFDFNGTEDVFLHDRINGTTECVSVDPAGFPSNGQSGGGQISGDGRYVCFMSRATDIGPGSISNKFQVYVYDRVTKNTELVSLDMFWNESNDSAMNPAISHDGRFVAFYGWGSDLVPGDTNGLPDYFVRDRLLGVTERISIDSNGLQAATPHNPFDVNYSFAAGISADGRYVTFTSSSDNLVPGDTNLSQDVFIRDRQLGSTERVNVSSDGNQVVTTNPYNVISSVSDDGRYVCFNSADNGLVPNDTHSGADVFVRDLLKEVTELVHLNSDGIQGNGQADLSSMTPDGRFVILPSFSNNLVTGDTNSDWDVFLHDRMTGGPDVDLTNVFAGQTATLTITGATPGGLVVLGASLNGQGILPTAWGPLELNGVSAVFAYVMDGAGQANVQVGLNPALLGLPLWVQGIDLTMDFPTSIWGGTIQ